MAKRSKTAAEKRYHEIVAQIPCVLCDALGQGPSRSQVHHIREGQGTSQRASHWLVVAVCADCHSGPLGIHGSRALLTMAKVSELDLLALTIEKVMEAV